MILNTEAIWSSDISDRMKSQGEMQKLVVCGFHCMLEVTVGVGRVTLCMLVRGVNFWQGTPPRAPWLGIFQNPARQGGWNEAVLIADLSQ